MRSLFKILSTATDSFIPLCVLNSWEQDSNITERMLFTTSMEPIWDGSEVVPVHVMTGFTDMSWQGSPTCHDRVHLHVMTGFTYMSWQGSPTCHDKVHLHVMIQWLTNNAVGDVSIAASVSVTSHDGVYDGHVGILRHRQMVEVVLEDRGIVILIQDIQHHCSGVVEGREGTVLHIGCHRYIVTYSQHFTDIITVCLQQVCYNRSFFLLKQNCYLLW